MTVNLSVKNVPEELAEKLRARAQRNRRSLQRELLSILEAAVEERGALSPDADTPRRGLTVEQVAARARELFPRGTDSSVAYLRELRDSR